MLLPNDTGHNDSRSLDAVARLRRSRPNHGERIPLRLLAINDAHHHFTISTAARSPSEIGLKTPAELTFNGLPNVRLLAAAPPDSGRASRASPIQPQLPVEQQHHLDQVAGIPSSSVRRRPPPAMWRRRSASPAATTTATPRLTAASRAATWATSCWACPTARQLRVGQPGQRRHPLGTTPLYIQDSFKASQQADSLEFGLRWELHPPFYRFKGGNITNFDRSVPITGRVIIPSMKRATEITAPGFLLTINACPAASIPGACRARRS